MNTIRQPNADHKQFTTNSRSGNLFFSEKIAFSLRCSITLLSLPAVFYASYLFSAHLTGQEINTIKGNGVKSEL